LYIENINTDNKEITVAIPLTTTSGKIRVKQRDNIYGYGLPFASRSKKFNLNNYIEWQIGYDIEVGKEYSNKIEQNLTTVKDISFLAYNGKMKYLYELSEYLFYFAKFGIFTVADLQKLKSEISSIDKNSLIDSHPHCQIKRTHPREDNINGLDFEVLKIEYPQLIHKFGDFEIITEITIREKQRAVGVQPMLYFCFPITKLESDEVLIGRTAKKKELAYFKFNKDNAYIVFEMLRIFGMLSISHQYDSIAILDSIINYLKDEYAK